MDIPPLNLGRAQAIIGTDEAGRSTLVVTDGTVEIVFSCGDSHREALRGSARLRAALWDYQALLLSQPTGDLTDSRTS